jgi:hypothetical protein
VQAKNDCKAKGMQLVTIESPEESNAILEAIGKLIFLHDFMSNFY